MRHRLASLPRAVALLVAGGAALAVLAVAVLVLRGDGTRQAIHRGAPVFNLVYDPAVVHPVAPRPGELMRLRAGSGSGLRLAVAVAPLTLPAYRGDVSGILPVVADRRIGALRGAVPRFALREEGKARVRDAPGYQVGYRYGPDGARTNALDVMIVPRSGERTGVVMSFRQTARGGPLSPSDQAVAKAARSAFRSLRFGTGRD